MMSYLDASELVFNEYAYSVEKHGQWLDYTTEQMLRVISQELMVEAGDAEKIGDIHGEHGVIRELSQVAACCMKAIMVLSSRKETLAETVRAGGEHSDVEGRASRTSPSLYQGKESVANHPKEGAINGEK